VIRWHNVCEVRGEVTDDLADKEGEKTMRMTHPTKATMPQDTTDYMPPYWSHAESTLDPEILSAAVLPEQFFFPPTTSNAGAPELGLMRAVIEDAVRCYQKQFVPGPRRNHALAREATQWFFDDDTTWPFSFLNLCSALGLDPGYIRRRLRHWRETRPVMAMQGKLRVVPSQRRAKLAA